jgi:hypothetical protein
MVVINARRGSAAAHRGILRERSTSPGFSSTSIDAAITSPRRCSARQYRRDGHRVHYAWITDSEVLDGATQTTTHEIVESVTDPEGSAILGSPGTCDGERWCEIADICPGGVKLHGVMVKPY